MGGKTKGRKPTRSQKILISSRGLKAENWLVLEDKLDVLYVVNKSSGKIRSIVKE